jgi:ABC-type branched-subunit amino acid transport system permease subunit
MLLGLLPALANGTLGLFLLGGALFSAVLHVALGPRQGKTIIRALIEVLIVGGGTFALIYGCILRQPIRRFRNTYLLVLTMRNSASTRKSTIKFRLYLIISSI